MRPVGWRNEGYRHGLASRGISTGRYLARKRLQYRPTSETYWRKRFKLDMKDRLKGGRADGKNPKSFDPKQLAMGIKHEREHTDDPRIAREIAMDHLAEDSKYYSHLNAMERRHGYHMTKEKAKEWADNLKSFFDDGRAQTPDYQKLHRDQLAQEEYVRVQKDLQFDESDGKIRTGTTEKFLDDDFTNETKDFLDRKIDYTTYRSNLDRRLKKHKEQNNSRLQVFGWMR